MMVKDTPQTQIIWVVWNTDQSGYTTSPIGYCATKVEAEAFAFNRFKPQGQYDKPQPATGEIAVLTAVGWFFTAPNSFNYSNDITPNRRVWPLCPKLELGSDEVARCNAMLKLTPDERKLLKLV